MYIERINEYLSEDLSPVEQALFYNYNAFYCIPFNVGFRRFEIKPIDQIAGNGKPYICFFVNGQPLKMKGVNIHEHNEATGHYVPEELMRKDFELMKQHNINNL